VGGGYVVWNVMVGELPLAVDFTQMCGHDNIMVAVSEGWGEAVVVSECGKRPAARSRRGVRLWQEIGPLIEDDRQPALKLLGISCPVQVGPAILHDG
jgi:hypothetical protein